MCNRRRWLPPAIEQMVNFWSYVVKFKIKSDLLVRCEEGHQMK